MLKTEYLYYLLEVAKTNSIHIAAEVLHLTPSAISHALKRLEQDLNLKLLDRSSRGVYLTPAGVKLSALVGQAVRDLEKIESVAQCIVKEQQNNCRPTLLNKSLVLGVQPAISMSLLPNILNELYKINPDLDLIVAEESLEKIEQSVKQDIDTFGIVLVLDQYLTAIIDQDQLRYRSFYQTKAHLMTAPNSVFLPRGIKEISLKKVLTLPMVTIKHHSAVQEGLLALLRREGEPFIFFQAPSLNVLQFMIENDSAVCLGINMAFTPFAHSNQYQYISFKENIKVHLILLYNQHADEKIIDVLAQTIHANLKGY